MVSGKERHAVLDRTSGAVISIEYLPGAKSSCVDQNFVSKRCRMEGAA